MIRQEAAALAASYEKIRRSQAAVPVFPACTVRPGRSSKSIQGAGLSRLTEIVTDVPSVYEEIQAFLIQNGLDSQITLRRYDDPQLPLSSCILFPPFSENPSESGCG